ncbi:MAG TPA: glycosyltransferase [Gammaproteobacteria bacterium]|nr:glycosyltransferase [Gammaproteobacteria bacterium]
MQVTFINNTPMRSGVFAAHLLALIARVDRRRHTVNFVTLRQEQPFEPVQRVVNGELLFWRRSSYGKVSRVLRASDVVVCRNYGAAFLALVLKKVMRARYRVHADLRGGVPDEILAYGRFPKNYLLYPPAKLMERVIVRSSTSISCVSGPFREYLLERGANPATTTVVPNGADMARCAFDPAARAAVRKELALEDNLVFVFSGSVRSSARPDRIVRLFKAIHAANSRARLLILTPNTALFAALCKDIGVSAFTMRTLDPDQVPRYLMAADYAFLAA